MTQERAFPVVEIFGPVLQGEGRMIGAQTLFVRLGLCDFRCQWCDSLYAVTPEQVQTRSTPTLRGLHSPAATRRSTI